jgi:hypothetical protein
MQTQHKKPTTNPNQQASHPDLQPLIFPLHPIKLLLLPCHPWQSNHLTLPILIPIYLQSSPSSRAHPHPHPSPHHPIKLRLLAHHPGGTNINPRKVLKALDILLLLSRLHLYHSTPSNLTCSDRTLHILAYNLASPAVRYLALRHEMRLHELCRILHH